MPACFITGLPFSNQAQNFLTSASALTGQPQINPKILPNAFTLVVQMIDEMVQVCNVQGWSHPFNLPWHGNAVRKHLAP